MKFGRNKAKLRKTDRPTRRRVKVSTVDTIDPYQRQTIFKPAEKTDGFLPMGDGAYRRRVSI